MQSSIKKLLSDIQLAERKSSTRPEEEGEHNYWENEFKEIDQYIAGTGDVFTIKDILNLDKEDFPNSDLLSEEEILSILIALDKTLYTWNIAIEYPEEMPKKEQYHFFIEHSLDYETMIMDFGCMHLDFCTGDPTDCEWGTYCSCKKYFTDEDESEAED